MKRLALFFLVAITGCQSAPVEAVAQPAHEVPTQVDSMRYFLNAIDSATLKGEELVLAAGYFAKNDSAVKSSAPGLMKAGLVCMNEGRTRLVGVNYLIALTRIYPSHEYAPEALMQLGLFFQNEIQDSQRSAQYLRTLVERYPTHPLASDAQQLLLLMGGDDELETVRNWLNKN